MKYSYIGGIIFFVFGVNISIAQTFATNDAEWIFDYSGALHSGITKVTYLKDTIIRSRDVKIFTKEEFRLRNNRDTGHYFIAPIYLHSSKGVVEFSMDKINFDTLINFNAKIDRSWTIYRYNNNVISDSLLITILDTFRITKSNVPCFSQQIKWTYIDNRTEYSYIDTVYEHIGFRWTYIFPFDALDVTLDGGEGGFLRCFKNDVLGVVPFYSNDQSSYIYDCDELTNVKNDNPSTFDFAISPNPARAHVNINFSLDRPESIRLEIIDALGVHFTTLIDNEYSDGQHNEEISIAHLAAGVYYCRLFVGDKNVGVKKMMVIK